MATPTVLVVDDDHLQRVTLGGVLRHAGFEVREAGTGEEALRQVHQGGVSLVLLDVVLPGLDGYQVCRRLKADAATAAVPVVLLSGLGSRTEQRVLGLDAGADSYLSKPVDLDELVAQVRAVLRVRLLQQERDQLAGRLQLHIERLPLAYITVDAACRITAWNQAAERVFGFRREEVLGGDGFQLLVPPQAWQVGQERLRRLRAGDMTAHGVNENRTKGGRTVVCQWHNTPLLNPDGTFAGVLSLAEDITGRLRLEEQFRQAQKMTAIGQLAGSVAHDFNNLLTIINGYSELLLQDRSLAAPQRELLTQVHRAGEQSASLTRQLLAFSRKAEVAPRVLDLNALVAENEKMLRRLLGETIELTTSLAPGLGNVQADPGQLEQVLLNLAVNARDAMPQGGRLTIETQNVPLDEAEVRPGPYVLLAVSDTGHGMSAEVRDRLFEPFFTTKEAGKGTGLGLATVYGVVKQAEGHIRVYSEPGLGTAFKIYLPRAEPQATPGQSAPAPPQLPRGTETVLLVEDDEVVRSVARHVLEASGYRVLAAGSGAEALLLAAGHPDPLHLLVTDVVLPKMSGPDLAQQLAASRPALRVLFLSGYTAETVVGHGLLAGQAPFLQKPFGPSALARKVREVLDSTP